MKRRTSRLILAGTLLLLLAASIFLLRVGRAFSGEVNAFPGVTMTAVEGTASSNGITVEVLNTTDLDISSGNEALLGLQMELGGQWYWLNAFPGGISTTLEAYLYGSGSPRELELDWGRSYGSLWPGHYRVTKWFSAEQPSGDDTDFLLAAEFTLE